MDMKGRWLMRNRTLVQVHLNSSALPGNGVERWIGHSVPDSRLLKVCWNENGECVWTIPANCTTGVQKEYDLMERPRSGLPELGIWVSGCGECDREKDECRQ